MRCAPTATAIYLSAMTLRFGGLGTFKVLGSFETTSHRLRIASRQAKASFFQYRYTRFKNGADEKIL